MSCGVSHCSKKDETDRLKILFFLARASADRAVINDTNFLFLCGDTSTGKTTFTEFVILMNNVRRLKGHLQILENVSNKTSLVLIDDAESGVFPDYELLTKSTISMNRGVIPNRTHVIVVSECGVSHPEHFTLDNGKSLPRGSAISIEMKTKFVADPDNHPKKEDYVEKVDVGIRNNMSIFRNSIDNIITCYRYMLDKQFKGNLSEVINHIDKEFKIRSVKNKIKIRR